MFKYGVLRELMHSTSLSFKREKNRMYLTTIGINDFHMHRQSHLKMTMNFLGTDCSLQGWADEDAMMHIGMSLYL